MPMHYNIGQDHPDTLLSQHQLALVVYTQGLWKHNYNHTDKLNDAFELFEVGVCLCIFKLVFIYMYTYIYIYV